MASHRHEAGGAGRGRPVRAWSGRQHDVGGVARLGALSASRSRRWRTRGRTHDRSRRRCRRSGYRCRPYRQRPRCRSEPSAGRSTGTRSHRRSRRPGRSSMTVPAMLARRRAGTSRGTVLPGGTVRSCAAPSVATSSGARGRTRVERRASGCNTKLGRGRAGRTCRRPCSARRGPARPGSVRQPPVGRDVGRHTDPRGRGDPTRRRDSRGSEGVIVVVPPSATVKS